MDIGAADTIISGVAAHTDAERVFKRAEALAAFLREINALLARGNLDEGKNRVAQLLSFLERTTGV